MNWVWLFFLIFGLAMIFWPELIAFLIWTFFLIIWLFSLGVFFASKKAKDTTQNQDEPYIQFWKYKIYTNKK